MNISVDQILHCDCVDGMKSMPDACIPLTVTSPPYDGIRTYGGHEFNFEAVARELWRITMVGGVLVWIIQDQVVKGAESGTSFRHRQKFEELGFRTHQTIIMRTSGFRFPSTNRYPKQFHYGFVLSKGKSRYVNLLKDRRNVTAGARIKHNARNEHEELTTVKRQKRTGNWGMRTNVWDYQVGLSYTSDREAYRHPALMSELMAEDHILSWSKPGDIVFDPMCGAGTTCKAALLNHRHYLGMEIHEPYWEIAVRRLGRAREEYVRRLIDGFGEVA